MCGKGYIYNVVEEESAIPPLSVVITKNAFLKPCNRLSLNYVTVAVVRNHFLDKAEESRITGRVPNKPLNFILDDYHGKQEEVA